jgi:predicted nucleic acid-binding protein
MVDELLDVLMLPRIHDRHGLTDAEVLEYLAALFVDARRYPGATPVSPRITRDTTDTKFLSVAVEADADYLVTKDRRHFLRLGQDRGTHVVTPTQFLRALS